MARAYQLSLFDAIPTPPSTEVITAKAQRLAQRLSQSLGATVRLFVTDNRSSMFQFRAEAQGFRIRMHHLFLDAPEHVVHAMSDYVSKGAKKAGRQIDAHIRAHGSLVRTSEPRPLLPPRTVGKHFNLQEIFERINCTFFGGAIEATIGWGKMPAKRRRRSIRLGVYYPHLKTIRIHPLLDREEVPLFFVEFIVFHEMLHQSVPSSRGAGRRIHHSPEFRTQEKQFPHFREAISWEKDHLSWLLRSLP